MTLNRATSGALLVVLIGLFPTTALAQGGSIGTVTASGAARVDGQAPSATPVGGTTRLSTGSGGTISVALTRGGELRLGEQTDVVVTDAGDQLRIQLVCGEVTAATPAPFTIVARNGARVGTSGGTATVTVAGKPETVKDGTTSDYKSAVTISAGSPGARIVATSTIRCDCDCTNSPAGRP